ncbi:hypothetical protein GCM10018966_016720 [Streptomyces yanii]
MKQWPEGPSADPEAARERYDSGMRALREVIRADVRAAHVGLGIVIIASVIVGAFAGSVVWRALRPSHRLARGRHHSQDELHCQSASSTAGDSGRACSTQMVLPVGV